MNARTTPFPFLLRLATLAESAGMTERELVECRDLSAFDFAIRIEQKKARKIPAAGRCSCGRLGATVDRAPAGEAGDVVVCSMCLAGSSTWSRGALDSLRASRETARRKRLADEILDGIPWRQFDDEKGGKS